MDKFKERMEELDKFDKLVLINRIIQLEELKQDTEIGWSCRCGNQNKRQNDYNCHSCGMKNKS